MALESEAALLEDEPLLPQPLLSMWKGNEYWNVPGSATEMMSSPYVSWSPSEQSTFHSKLPAVTSTLEAILSPSCSFAGVGPAMMTISIGPVALPASQTMV